MILANKIMELRKKSGWSQEELADQLNVSRQAVSKWESAQSVPDLERVLAMSRIFGVSTDYLLKDEMEEVDSAPVEERISPLRQVSMEEAGRYLRLVRDNAWKVALAVVGCIVSPIPLLLLVALSDMNRLQESVAVLTGLVFLLVTVACAVAMFIHWGMKVEPYEYLEKEPIETAYGVSGMVREQQMTHRGVFMRNIVVGVVLCVLSPLPLLSFSLLTQIGALIIVGVCVLLIMVAVAGYLIVSASMVEGSFRQLLEEGEYTRAHKRVSSSPWPAVFWCAVTAVYLGWSFYAGDWQRTWLVWPVAGLIFGGLSVFRAKKNKGL